MTLVSRDTVLDELRTVVAETLRVERDSVQPESSLVADLGAASLDVLDINYRLEQIFGIRMARHFFLEHAEELLGEGTVIDDSGLLTKQGVELLGLRYGAAATEAARDGLSIDEVSSLITVEAVADAICEILASHPDSCHCGASQWHTEEGRRVRCTSCNEPARFTDGDELILEWLNQRLAPGSA